MDNTNIVDVLIENITTDKKLLEQADGKISQAKEDKQIIVERLKSYRKDVSVFLKYADKERQKQLEDLGFTFEASNRELNTIASAAFDIIMKTKGNKLTNVALYDTYVKSLKNEADAVSYTEFNIKCRTLFNTQRLIRTKGDDPKSSRDDIISLNGSVTEIQIQTKKTQKK